MHDYDNQLKYPKPRILFVLLLLLVSEGCMNHRENLLQDAEYRLLGKTKAELIECAGKPSATRQKDGNELLIYTNGLASSEYDSCKLTFILNQGKVIKFDFDGNLSGMRAPAQTCYQVIRNCW
jgi:hypothetical protein